MGEFHEVIDAKRIYNFMELHSLDGVADGLAVWDAPLEDPVQVAAGFHSTSSIPDSSWPR